MFKPTVAIVGGGAAGILTAVNLILKSTPLDIFVVNSGSNFGTGVAYNPPTDSHLLNVMTKKMSAFSDEPEHFVDWIVDSGMFPELEKEILGITYLPRTIYGNYLRWIWESSKQKGHPETKVTEVIDRAVNITLKPKGDFEVHLLNGKTIAAHFVILATGNSLPRKPPIPNMSFYNSANYINNPWGNLNAVQVDKDILIIGNGLTMVDVVQTLVEKGLKGTIHSISPHGFGILQHQHHGIKYEGLMKDLINDISLSELVSLLNKHIKKVGRLGLSAELVIDSLRPRAQGIWQSLSFDEKRKFMSRLRHLWGVARHRLPIQIYDFMQRLKIEGRLKIWAGSLRNIVEHDENVIAQIHDSKSGQDRSLNVSLIINCTGPEVDIERIDDHLFANLLESGMISPHPLKLGLNVDPDSLLVVNKDNFTIDSFYAIGGLLRGVLWESTAIPEIRVQAKAIADRITQIEN